MAARRRPSRWEADSPSRSSGIVTGGPAGLPSGETIQASRWPWFRSTASTGVARSSSSAGAGRPGAPPGRVEVPAVPPRGLGDVVPDRAAGRLRGHLVAAVGETDGAFEPVAAVRGVRQVRQRGGEPDFQPALVRVPSGPSRFPAVSRLPRPRSGTSVRRPIRAATAPCSSRHRPARGGPSPAVCPPRHTLTRPAVIRLSTPAWRVRSACSLRCFSNRSAGEAFPAGGPASSRTGSSGGTRLSWPGPAGWRARPAGSGPRAARHPRWSW